MAKELREFDHQYHVNLNKFNQDKHGKDAFQHWMYECKNAAQERRRLPILFKRQREGTLPKAMKYCSHSQVEEITENKLMCCLGKEVSTCEYLCAAFKDMEGEFQNDLLDQAKADFCVGHILQEVGKRRHSFDTSEGYITDESERRFWQRTYEYMAMPDPDIAEAVQWLNDGNYGSLQKLIDIGASPTFAADGTADLIIEDQRVRVGQWVIKHNDGTFSIEDE